MLPKGEEPLSSCHPGVGLASYPHALHPEHGIQPHGTLTLLQLGVLVPSPTLARVLQSSVQRLLDATKALLMLSLLV